MLQELACKIFLSEPLDLKAVLQKPPSLSLTEMVRNKMSNTEKEKEGEEGNLWEVKDCTPLFRAFTVRLDSCAWFPWQVELQLSLNISHLGDTRLKCITIHHPG